MLASPAGHPPKVATPLAEPDGRGLRLGLRSTPNPSTSVLSWPDSRNAPAADNSRGRLFRWATRAPARSWSAAGASALDWAGLASTRGLRWLCETDEPQIWNTIGLS